MNVLGPFQFLPGNTEEDNCGCGGDYCHLVNNGDTLAFQISVEDTCCVQLAGCDSLTEECVDSQDLTIFGDGAQEESGVCWDDNSTAPVDGVLISGEIPNLDIGTEYMICVCISGALDNTEFQAFVDTDDSVVFTGSGNHCLRITRTSAVSPSVWGIKIISFDTLNFCFSCLTICTTGTFIESVWTPKWEAFLVDENQEEILEITGVPLDSGNIAFEQNITVGEVGTGCRQIKLVDNCNEEILYSQCLQIQAAHECTLLFKWRDIKNVFGFDYLTDDTYYNYLRVRGRIKHPSYRTEKGLHLLSNNNNILTNATVQKILTVALSTPGVPDYVHEQIALALVHQEFYIDDTEYVADDGDYSPAWRRSSELAASQFEVIAQDFDGVNTYCS